MSAEISTELLEAAKAALIRQEARKGENADEWAERLANDLAKFED